MDNGWIKIHRKLLENIVFQNEKALKIWIWCLLRANHQNNEYLLGRKKIDLKRGQFIFGRNSAEEDLKISGSTIYFWLQFLKDNSYINIKSTSKYSIITILNYNKYQTVDSKPNNKWTADGQQMDTDKNVKNEKNDKNVILYSPKSLELAKLLYDLIKEENPKWYIKPNWDSWADDIDKIQRIDGRTYEQIEWIIKWVQQDDFWKQNILSPAKLRKQFNNLIVKAKGQSQINKVAIYDKRNN